LNINSIAKQTVATDINRGIPIKRTFYERVITVKFNNRFIIFC